MKKENYLKINAMKIQSLWIWNNGRLNAEYFNDFLL